MKLNKHDRIVLKFGTACLEDRKRPNNIDKDMFYKICEKTSYLFDKGYDPLIVTSGAVFMGMNEMGLDRRPENVEDQQYLASIGQPGLMRLFQEYFNNFNLAAGQILVTHDSMKDPRQRRNIVRVNNKGYRAGDLHKSKKGSIAVFNENDAISSEELKKEGRGEKNYFDDNDMLSYLAARDFKAKAAVMFNPKGGLYNDEQNLISEVRFSELADVMRMIHGRDKSAHGRGGLAAKVNALGRCASEGTYGIMAGSGSIKDPKISFTEIIEGGAEGTTVFYPKEK